MKNLLRPSKWFGSKKRRQQAQRKHANRRRLQSEALEKRQLLAGDFYSSEFYTSVEWNSHHNALAPTDTNADGMISLFDALGPINALSEGLGFIPLGEGVTSTIDTDALKGDVNDDGMLTPLDVLLVLDDIDDNGLRAMDPLLEHILTIRDFQGNEIAANASNQIEVDVNEVFEIEFGYRDLRLLTDPFSATGAFSIWADLNLGGERVLEPVLTETQILNFDSGELAGIGANPTTFTFTDGTNSYTTPEFSSLTAFIDQLDDEISNALTAFNYTTDQFTVSPASFGGGQPVSSTIRFTDFADPTIANQDLPDITVMANATTVTQNTIDIPPVLADGTINNSALEFNINTVSRSFNNQPLYEFLNVGGTFDSNDGFGNVGGAIESPFVGGIPAQTGQLLANPFDSFSFLARLTAPSTGTTITTGFVDPAVRSESLTMFDVPMPITDADLVTIDDEAMVTLVTPGNTGNNPPVISGPISQTFAESAASAPIDLLQNATDADGDTLTVTINNTTGNTVGIDTTNLPTLTVDPSDYVDLIGAGQDEEIVFEYTVSDGQGGSASTTATITITGEDPPNTLPTVTGPVTQTFTEDDQPAPVSLLAGATDADGDSLSIQNLTLVSGDAVGIEPDEANSRLTVTPQSYSALNTGQQAVVEYSYQISDGEGTIDQTATVTITGITDTVNTAPVLGTTPLQFTISEDDPNGTLDLLFDATDGEGNTLNVVGITTGGDLSGLTVNGNVVDTVPGNYTTLPANDTAQATFTYSISDGSLSTAQQATVTITGVNDAPTVANALTFTLDESDSSLTSSLLEGASDVDTGSTLNVVNPSITGTDTSGVSVTGNNVVIDPSQYSSLNTGQSATVNISFNISDGIASVAQTATITINGEGSATGNNAPVLAQSPLNFTITEDDPILTVDGLQGASDPDGDTLSIDPNSVNITGDAAVTTNTDSTFSLDPSQFNALNTGESRSGSVTFNIVDGNGGSVTQTVNVTVTGITDTTANNAPTSSGPLSFTFNEDDATGTVNLIANASDADGDSLSVSNIQITGDASGITTNGTTAEVRPGDYGANLNAGQNEVITLNYTISDGNGGSVDQTATITITGENDGPGIFTISGSLFVDHLENLPAVIAGTEAPFRDGIQQSDEAGLAGILVTLTSPSGATRTTTTNIRGEYSFPNVSGGDYNVSYDVPEGVMHTNPTSGTVSAVNGGPTGLSGPNLGIVGMQGPLSNVNFLASSYLMSNQDMSATTDGGLQGGSVLLDSNGNQDLFIAGLGFESGVKFAELSLNEARDAALLTILDSNDDVKIARLSDEQFVVSGNAVQFFGGMEDFSFTDSEAQLLTQEFPNFRNAIDQAMADGI